MSRRPALALPFGLLVASTTALPAQDERDTDTAAAIRQWAHDFERVKLQPKNLLRPGRELQPDYVPFARRAGFVHDGDEGRLTHLDLLGKLLAHAEQHPNADLADAVLGIAAAGFDSSFLDREAMELRELGHWTLMRFEHQAAWFLLLRAAAGEQVPVLGDLHRREQQPDQRGLVVGPARRVAALHLLGRRNLPVFRSTIEAALTDPEPRVRLAACEAIRPPFRAETAQRLAVALAGERHPVVSQGLVRALQQLLRSPDGAIDRAGKVAMVQGALAQFGRCGWRTDMDLLDLIEAFPQKEAIPTLLAVLDGPDTTDQLVSAVNRQAHPQRRERALGLLRAMTGALIPGDDPKLWRAFWQREESRLVVPPQLAKRLPEGTSAAFFGVPVTGTNVVFLIDTSGSMEKGSTQPSTGPRRRGEDSRLAVAKEQLLLCAQAMAKESRLSVLTFADGVHRWTEQPVAPGTATVRSLTELLGRCRPHGGTNLHDGLALALQWNQQRYADLGGLQIDELFVLSDGEPTVGAVQAAEDLLTLVRESNRYAKVRIHGVFTGAGNGPGRELLQALAEQNGGVFVQR
ncbi:MAG: VWA domain-containing protein [Planctomycetes bacterium]|jgi:hypothetical protein|nr:VWA domain-containing protein [Planctomycetota bacterium]